MSVNISGDSQEFGKHALDVNKQKLIAPLTTCLKLRERGTFQKLDEKNLKTI